MKRSPIPKEMQMHTLNVARAAYAYIREVDHPIRDSVMIQIELNHLRHTMNDLPYEARAYIGGLSS